VSAEQSRSFERRLADLRHDLRTPVGHILGFSEFLLEDDAIDDPATLEDVRRIHSAGQRLLSLIEERLTMTALGAERNPVIGSPEVISPPLPVAPNDDTEEDCTVSVAESDGLFLIVDDSEENRRILTGRLQRLGHRTLVAAEGKEALRRLSEEKVDLVFLDIMMPGMDGFAVLQAIKSNPALATVSVIVISALNEIESVARCIALGAEDYLIKPFNPILLNARVTGCLQSKRARDRERRLSEQLQESLERLQAAEKLRDDLTGMIVHDLRIPLTSILSGLQTMEMLGGASADQKQMLGITLQGAHALLGMINDLLDVSKQEDASLKLDYVPLQAGTLIESAVQQVTLLAQYKGVRFEVTVEPPLLEFAGDEEKLRRMLVNLLGNAIKFTPGEGTVSIRAGIGDEGDICFSVRDTGEGIPEEAFARIFEKFGQVENHRAGRKMSTGLGLTFCKMVAEAHGGRIWVESQVGVGSVFSFTIPHKR
jgi:signal transduction histidine kinase